MRACREFGKLGYATMILLRAQIVQGGSSTLGKAVTIAVRYSAVRRQFAAADSGERSAAQSDLFV